MSAAPPSLEHLRIFAEVVDAGGFSAAARQLDKSQPAISYAIAALEGQLGLSLFERGRRKPVLTPAGLAILAYARRISQLSDELAANAASLLAGLEGTLLLAVDTFFPTEVLGAGLADLARTYPSVAIDLRVRSREWVLQDVVEGDVAFGVCAVDVAWPQGIEARDFGRVEIFGVAAPEHPLASHPGPIPTMVLRDSLQITNRSAAQRGEADDVAVNSSRIWRVSGLPAQVELLKRGLGWGYLPRHVADPAIASGQLVRLDPASRRGGVQPWSLIYRAANPPGPAARYLEEQLKLHLDHQGF